MYLYNLQQVMDYFREKGVASMDKVYITSVAEDADVAFCHLVEQVGGREIHELTPPEEGSLEDHVRDAIVSVAVDGERLARIDTSLDLSTPVTQVGGLPPNSMDFTRERSLNLSGARELNLSGGAQ